MCSRRGKKRLNEELEPGDVPRRRRRTPGFTPFKQVEIPASWRFESQKLREAVRTSVAHCHYDDQSKRERLGNAVFEALSGQKTMKAAATTHGVPFTTLQTYFHRSRARMAKMMSDSDNALPEQIQIPVSLSLSSSDTDNALAEEKVSSVELGKSGRLDCLLGILADRMVKKDISGNVSSLSPDIVPRKTGSNKRKPKEVHRIAPTSLRDESLEDDNGPLDWYDDQSRVMFHVAQNGDTRNIGTRTNEAPQYEKDELMSAVKCVAADFALDEDTKNSVKEVVEGILSKSLSIDDVCTSLKLNPALVQSCVDRIEQVLKCPDGSLYKNEKNVKKANEYDKFLSLDAENAARLDKVDKCISDVCRVSHYPASQKEALRKAVAMVIRGEYSVSGAASIMQLPTSTVHPYVHRARAALETFLPQQANGTAFCINKKHIKEEAGCGTTANAYSLLSGNVSTEMEKVISDLVHISTCDEAEQQRLHDAISEVLTKDAPVAEVASKYEIPTSIIQPYVMKARVLLGQSPYPTTSGSKGSNTALNTKSANDMEKPATGEVMENNLSKVLTNMEPLQFGNFPPAEGSSTEGCSRRKRRCSTGDVSNEDDVKEKEPLMDSLILKGLDGAAGNSDSSSEEFDRAKHIQLSVAKVRPRRGKQSESLENVAYYVKAELPTKSAAVSNVENGSDRDSDDEFDGLPRSIRGVAKLLSDTKLDKVSTKDYAGTPENLANKIDKVLRQYRFRGDREKMRDAILEVLYESKTLNEACRGNNLAPTTLSTYVRLVKALINTDRAGAKGVARTLSSPNSSKSSKNDNFLYGIPSVKSGLRNGTFSAELVEKGARGVSAAISSSSSKMESIKAGNGQNSDMLSENTEMLSDAPQKQFTKEGTMGGCTNMTPCNIFESFNMESGQNFSASLILNGTLPGKSFEKDNPPAMLNTIIEEKMNDGAEQLIQNVNVMMLHAKPIMNNLESFYKLLIAYLIEQQYRRSEEAQEKMRASLEYVLLDGLSVAEALKVHKGPTDHVLQVYLNRCREAYKCIKTEFANFKTSFTRAISKNCTTASKTITGLATSSKNTAVVTKNNNATKRSSKRLQKKEDSETSTDVVPTVGSLKHLNAIFSENLRKPLYDYLKKLDDVNFPIEDCLIVGLAKIIIEELPVEQKFSFADSIWDQWLVNYRKEHPEFDD